MNTTTMLQRVALASLVLVACIVVPLAGGMLGKRDRTANAGPPTSSVIIDPIPHVPPSSKGPKPPPKPASVSDDKPAPACLKARYDALAAKVPELRLKFPADDAGFKAAYAAEKEALVSDSSLAAAGCVK